MKFVVFGVGAIGGTLAARLLLSGFDVSGIARGRQLETIRQNGLLLRTPAANDLVRLPCFGSPSELEWQGNEIVILTMKSQDSQAALLELREAGVRDQAIVCAQNGVVNETMALRLFPNVYGCTVMMPAAYTAPGEINAFGVPKHGIFDIGRFPSGSDDVTGDLCDALDLAGFAAFPHQQVMRSKYGKLLQNTGNVVDAALGPKVEQSELAALARKECVEVYRAAGISYNDLDAIDPDRKGLMLDTPIPGAARIGSSSAQSLFRGAGSIETDYLNGEIVLLGRMHGMPVPVNTFLTDLGRRLLAGQIALGALDPATLQTELESTGFKP